MSKYTDEDIQNIKECVIDRFVELYQNDPHLDPLGNTTKDVIIKNANHQWYLSWQNNKKFTENSGSIMFLALKEYDLLSEDGSLKTEIKAAAWRLCLKSKLESQTSHNELLMDLFKLYSGASIEQSGVEYLKLSGYPIYSDNNIEELPEYLLMAMSELKEEGNLPYYITNVLPCADNIEENKYISNLLGGNSDSDTDAEYPSSSEYDII